jgi:uncharacterized protein (TIRG00374 family)
MGELLSSFETIQYIYLIPITLISLTIYVIRAFRWKVLIRPLHPATAGELLPPLAIGTLGNLLPLRAGEVLRGYLLKKKLNISFSSSLATIMVERIFDTLMLLLLMIWTFAFQASLFNVHVEWLGKPLKDVALGVGIVLAGIFIGLVFFILLLIFCRKWKHPLEKIFVKFFPEKWQGNVRTLVKNFILGLDMVRNPRDIISVTLYSILEWSLAITAYYFWFLAFNLHDPTIASLILVAILIPIFMTALPTPGFLGSIQVAIYIAVHEILGESAVTAAAFGMAAWGWGFITQTSFGIFYVVKEHLAIREVIELEEKGENELTHLE